MMKAYLKTALFSLLATAALFTTGTLHAQNMPKRTQSPTMQTQKNTLRLADRIALKELVDTFSNLADEKRVDEQMHLFTPNAKVISKTGKTTTELVGHGQIGKAFADYLALFHTVYHINGQQVIHFIDSTHAESTHYAQVILVKNENGKDIGTFFAVRYHDKYVKQGGKWLISERVSNFMVSETRPMAN